MGRPGVTYAEVAKAATEILEQGFAPTIERIRAKLETGSYSTLGVLLKEWRAKHALQQQYSANSQLPDELVTAVQKVWEVINEKTENQLIKIREETESDRQTLHQEINHEKQKTTQAETAYRELNEKLRVSSNEKSALEHALQEQHIHQASLLATQKSFENQLSEKQARIDELTRLNSQVQNNLEHYRQASREQRLLEQQQYETRLNELDQRNHKLQENWTTILTENTKLKSEFEQLVLTHEKLKKDYSALEKDQIEKAEKLSEMKQLLAEKIQLIELVSAQQKSDQEKIETQQYKIIELEKMLASSTEKNKGQTEQIKELASQNKLLAHEKWLLDCEKVQLIAQVERLVKAPVAA
jgi:hypothetical protein